jgi:hypothetical protein
MIAKISKEDILLPSTFDVLFHLPESEEMQERGYVVAHAVQYSICAMDKDMTDALRKLAIEVVARCELAAQRGIKPITMAPEHFLRAFFLGQPVSETDEMSTICEHLSQQLRSQFKTCGGSSVHLNMRMTNICEWQKSLGIAGVFDFIQRAA